jgi:type I restriction enzyme S subunit
MFLRYYLVSSTMQSHLLGLAAAGATRNALTKGMLEALSIVAPSLKEQRAIARILGALDDKIELNRRMNETLEALARALFQSWFVDFDPVRAKMRGEQPVGMDAATAALFPSRLVQTEQGEVPEGWAIESLEKFTSFVIGGDWGASEYATTTPAETRCIRGADIPAAQAGGLGNVPLRFLRANSADKRCLRSGDIVLEISGGSPTQSTGRAVLITPGLLAKSSVPLVSSNFCRLVRMQTPAVSSYVFQWLRQLYACDVFFGLETGTTGIKNLEFTHFAKRYPLLMPTSRLLEGFDVQLRAWLSLRDSLATESDLLASLRATLLPKLLSGELRVADVVEGA